MGSHQQDEKRLLLLQNYPPQNEREGPRTGDGSVDINGDPALEDHTGKWRACPFILGAVCSERLAYFGIGMNLVTYLTKKLHLENVSAATSATTWQGTCLLTPLVGAFLADSYWGRFWTIAVFSTIYFIGMILLTLSASVPALEPQPCINSVCPEPRTAQLYIFFFGLYLIAFGSGGIKPCISSFGADQFDDTDPTERMHKSSFFNWFYFCNNIGALVAGTLLVWIQDNRGWTLGFGIPTVFMALAVVSFFSGSKFYRFQRPGGSPLTRVVQVVVASLRKWNQEVPEDKSLLYELPGNSSAVVGSRKLEHSAQFEFFDKAAVVSSLDTNAENFTNPWWLCTVTQVEELKILVRMCPIWATCILFWVVYAQGPMFLEQGMVLNKTIGSFSIPPASLTAFNVISVLMLVPVYDRLLIPIVRRFTGREKAFSDIQRIGIGLFISMLAMMSAALVEIKRLELAKTERSMSILWQIPQYFLAGASEVFTAIGMLQFFYEEAPDAMRSFCSALALLTSALGSYLNSLILTVVAVVTTRGGKPGWIPDNLNKGHLDRFFWLITGLSCANLIVFVCCAIRYKSKEAS